MSKRIELFISIDLDRIPGAMHTEESAREVVQQVLQDRLGHYRPVVLNITKADS